MSDRTPSVLDLTGLDQASGAAGRLPAQRPVVLVARGVSDEARATGSMLMRLLRHPMPVTGVVEGRVGGHAAALLLSCDLLVMTPRSSLSLEPSGSGELTLLALRIGHAEASRVWFSGGRLRAARAARSGWAQVVREGFEAAFDLALHRYDGLSHPAIGLLRPLLYREAGLPLHLANALERAAFALAFDTGHPAEGVAAFLQKRGARFGAGDR
jgi:enoyl-CoA hydratase/carnithine racemase